jgi:D-glycero-alpha-D-manno-heptose-7-phosphate kinase
MIITKTPYRISLFGGGTDHPAWFKNHGGEVISFAIDKFCYLTTRVLPPFFEHNFRIAYSKIETVKNIDQILHPAVREGIRKFAPNMSLEIHHDGDLPARSGVGSSSAFAVGLINSLKLLQNTEMSAIELANEAIELEQIDLKENVGSQDQIACALGGLNYITFNKDSSWNADRISISKKFEEKLSNRIVTIFTGIQRSSSDIQANLVVDLEKKIETMERTIYLARECKNIVSSEGDLDLIGEMLSESWNLKKQMNGQAITPALNDVWERAIKSGAIGGKVLGAGGGGFCMFWVKENGREEFLKKFNLGTFVPVQISHQGSTCILK